MVPKSAPEKTGDPSPRLAATRCQPQGLEPGGAQSALRAALYCAMTSTNEGAAGGAGAALAGVAAALAQSMKSARVVDLSLTLSEDLPCAWPTAMPYRHVIDHWYETTTSDAGRPRLRCRTGVAFHTCSVGMDEHTGTHFDAPSHFIPSPESGLPNAGPAGTITADRVPLEQFFGPAAVIDVRSVRGEAGPGASPRIEPELVTDWEKANGAIAAGEVVLFRSDWDEHYVAGPAGRTYVVDPFVFSSVIAWPAPSPATMELLRDRGVRCVGTDAVSMGAADDGAPVHVAGLSAGMVFVECLSNLAELPARGATFLFLPIKIGEGSGGPGRALAFTDR